MPHPPPDAPGLANRRVPLASHHLDPSNAREHGTENMEAIVGSLKRFQQVEPLVVQKSTGRVIGGNGRLVAMRPAVRALRAAKALGATPAPGTAKEEARSSSS